MTTAVDPAIIRRIADMHAVYRLFDQSGRLLYIGMSGRAGRRFDDHAVKNWWPLVSMITLEWHDTHAAATLAERRAIAAERPRYNVAGTPVERKRAAKAAATPKAEAPAPIVPTPVLSDVLKVFGGAAGLHWQTLAERLAAQIPGRWAGATAEAVSANVRCLGVPSVQVWAGGRNRQGCRRADVEETAIRHTLAR